MNIGALTGCHIDVLRALPIQIQIDTRDDRTPLPKLFHFDGGRLTAALTDGLAPSNNASLQYAVAEVEYDIPHVKIVVMRFAHTL